MSEIRSNLKPRPRLQLRIAEPPSSKEALLRRAIATQSCVLAIYNKGRVKLAPYILYHRDGTIFLDAFTVERNGAAPREPKLGTFRLSGLDQLCPTIETFQPQTGIEIDPARYAAGIIARI